SHTFPFINNLSNHSEITNSFRSYFESTFVKSSDNVNALNEFLDLNSKNSNTPSDPFSIEISDIEKAINHLGLNKSPDPNLLYSEHFIYSHPRIFFFSS